jgi:hypothetical protein
MADQETNPVTVWCENALDKNSINAIRRLSGGDYSKRFIVGEPQATETKTIEELKSNRIIGIYMIVEVKEYR